MNERSVKSDTECADIKSPPDKNESKIRSNIYLNEQLIITEDTVDVEESFVPPNTQPPIDNFQLIDEDSAIISTNTPQPDDSDIPDPDPEVMYKYYEAWRNYKKSKKPKKKKNKMVEIYRDENYCTEDRFTDDEDFKYYDY